MQSQNFCFSIAETPKGPNTSFSQMPTFTLIKIKLFHLLYIRVTVQVPVIHGPVIVYAASMPKAFKLYRGSIKHLLSAVYMSCLISVKESPSKVLFKCIWIWLSWNYVDNKVKSLY